MGIFERRARTRERTVDDYGRAWARLETSVEAHTAAASRLAMRPHGERHRLDAEDISAAAESRRTILESDVYRMIAVGDLSEQDRWLEAWRTGVTTHDIDARV